MGGKLPIVNSYHTPGSMRQFIKQRAIWYLKRTTSRRVAFTVDWKGEKFLGHELLKNTKYPDKTRVDFYIESIFLVCGVVRHVMNDVFEKFGEH